MRILNQRCRLLSICAVIWAGIGYNQLHAATGENSGTLSASLRNLTVTDAQSAYTFVPKEYDCSQFRMVFPFTAALHLNVSYAVDWKLSQYDGEVAPLEVKAKLKRTGDPYAVDLTLARLTPDVPKTYKARSGQKLDGEQSEQHRRSIDVDLVDCRNPTAAGRPYNVLLPLKGEYQLTVEFAGREFTVPFSAR